MNANGGDQRLRLGVHEMSSALAETMAALLSSPRNLQSADRANNASETLATGELYAGAAAAAASSLLYWSGNGGVMRDNHSSSDAAAAGDSRGVNDGGAGVGVGVGVDDATYIARVVANSSQMFVEYNDTDDAYQQVGEQCQNYAFAYNKSYWNVTCDTPVDYAQPLYGFFMPFLLVITVLSNSLIVLVLRKKNMATPTNFVLMAMAICDMLTVIFPAPGLWYMYVFGNHYKPLHPVSLCMTFSFFNEIMPAMCHTASIWLTLALAVQRYIYVCHAPMARTWCTMPRVKRCTLYIVLIAFFHQSTRFIDRAYYPLQIEWNGEMTEVCNVVTASWVYAYVGEDLYFTYYFLFRVLFVHLLPCVILVTLNILLFRAMRQAQQRRKLLFRENRKKECKKLRESNCTTLMLIVVVTVFLIVEIPIAVVTMMHIVSMLVTDSLDYRMANIMVLFTNFFLVVSYPINFGIYCGMSRQFRETFKEIFLGRLIAKKENSSKYSIVNGPRTCTNTNETVL